MSTQTSALKDNVDLGDIDVLHLHMPVSNTEMRLPYCEYCGGTNGSFETHHIKSKGSGGREIRANKINLCVECHALAQAYEIKYEDLILVVARREEVSVEDVYTAIELPTPDKDIGSLNIQLTNKEQQDEMPSIEELLSVLVSTEEKSVELAFLKGQVVELLVECYDYKLSQIAHEIKRSEKYVEKHLKTFQAFRDEDSRQPNLDFTHYWEAAQSEDPEGWAQKASEAEMSTRELNNAIKESEGKKKEQDWQKKAEKALNDVKTVIEAGGEPAEFLLSELEKYFRYKQSNIKEEMQETA